MKNELKSCMFCQKGGGASQIHCLALRETSDTVTERKYSEISTPYMSRLCNNWKYQGKDVMGKYVHWQDEDL